MSERDDVLEKAALHVESLDIMEVAGIGAKRKRAREDAALRGQTIRETRVRIAREIRSLKERRDGDAVSILRRIKTLPAGYRHDLYLREAWPLAWMGLLDITATIKTNSNCVPPETEYRIVLTDKGRSLIEGETGSSLTQPVLGIPITEQIGRAHV